MADFDGLMTMLGAFLIVFLFIFVLIYVLISLLLYKLHKIIYGKGTVLAWIPILSIYVLGKVTFESKIVGIALLLMYFLTLTIETTVNGVTTTHSLLPSNILSTFQYIYSIVTILLLLYAIFEYFNLKKGGNINLNGNLPKKKKQVIEMKDSEIDERIEKLHSKNYIVDPRTGKIILKSEKSPAMVEKVEEKYDDLVKPTGQGLQVENVVSNVLDTFNFDDINSENIDEIKRNDLAEKNPLPLEQEQPLQGFQNQQITQNIYSGIDNQNVNSIQPSITQNLNIPFQQSAQSVSYMQNNNQMQYNTKSQNNETAALKSMVVARGVPETNQVIRETTPIQNTNTNLVQPNMNNNFDIQSSNVNVQKVGNVETSYLNTQNDLHLVNNNIPIQNQVQQSLNTQNSEVINDQNLFSYDFDDNK